MNVEVTNMKNERNLAQIPETSLAVANPYLVEQDWQAYTCRISMRYGPNW